MTSAGLNYIGMKIMACEYCGGDRVLYQHTHTTKMFVNRFGMTRTIEVECDPCPPYVDCCMKNVLSRSVFIINYCPNCGERLVNDDENWN